MTTLLDLATRLSILATILAACGNTATERDAAPPVDASPAIALRFERIAGTNDFDAIATLVGADGPITLEASRGSVGAVTPDGTGVRARITTTATGHHDITARAGDLAITRTALVLAHVDDAWGQPEPVRGLVNTAGWEDGASISPDGDVLTVQYLPVPIDCIIGQDPAAPACRVKGPVTAPERPRMPGASRVQADGTYQNGCPSIGLASLPVPAPPNAVYAFRRQADDSFADPHPIYFDGIDGCVGAFGFALRADGTAVYAFDDPRTDTDPTQLFLATVDATSDIVLGRFAAGAAGVELRDTLGVPITPADGGHQGNPHLLVHDGKRTIVFDDEGNRADLLFADEIGGQWSATRTIPAPVSVAGAQESQPFFDGNTLLFRRELEVLASDWSGGSMDQASSWSATRTILAGTNRLTGADVGEVVGVGEPSVTTGARRELYFVYVRRDADHTLQLDIARVPAR